MTCEHLPLFKEELFVWKLISKRIWIKLYSRRFFNNHLQQSVSDILTKPHSVSSIGVRLIGRRGIRMSSVGCNSMNWTKKDFMQLRILFIKYFPDMSLEDTRNVSMTFCFQISLLHPHGKNIIFSRICAQCFHAKLSS